MDLLCSFGLILDVKDSYQNIFGNNIRKLRAKLNLSQDDLAEASGLHRTYIGGIERGERNPSLKNIVKIARALNSKPTDLLKEVK